MYESKIEKLLPKNIQDYDLYKIDFLNFDDETPNYYDCCNNISTYLEYIIYEIDSFLIECLDENVGCVLKYYKQSDKNFNYIGEYFITSENIKELKKEK